MLDDAVKARAGEDGGAGNGAGKVRVVDIAQVLDDSLALRREPGGARRPDDGAARPEQEPPSTPLEESTTTGPTTPGEQAGPAVVDPSGRRPGDEPTVVEE
jgi:hypothetical protein